MSTRIVEYVMDARTEALTCRLDDHRLAGLGHRPGDARLARQQRGRQDTDRLIHSFLPSMLWPSRSGPARAAYPLAAGPVRRGRARTPVVAILSVRPP